MKFILGTKKNMSQVFDDKGVVHPVTVVKAGPVVVTQVKTQEKDGYAALQVGFGETREKLVSKPQKGHFKDKGLFKVVREFRMPDSEISHAEGDTINVSTFSVGDVVEVSGTSKGKGFQGVVKRHGFAGGRRSHGQKHSEREAGSIGGSGGRAGGRVAKGIRMAGRMGGDRVTVKGLTIVQIDADNGDIYIEGAIPGKPGDLIEIRG
jgi:large subunit ribosomal protein L3